MQKMQNLEQRENFSLDKDTEVLIVDINTKIDIIAPYTKPRAKASDIFSKIVENKSADIHITGISFVSAPDGSISAEVSGVSATRESLIQFLKKLDGQNVFQKVDLPVSNFVKNKDLDFDFSLKVLNTQI